jgi:hypothetical protein
MEASEKRHFENGIARSSEKRPVVSTSRTSAKGSPTRFAIVKPIFPFASKTVWNNSLPIEMFGKASFAASPTEHNAFFFGFFFFFFFGVTVLSWTERETGGVSKGEGEGEGEGGGEGVE